DDARDDVDLSGTDVTVRAGGSVLVQAFDKTGMDLIAGSVSGGGSVGVGASAAVVVSNKNTSAFIGGNASVTGLGAGAGVEAYTGGFTVGSVEDAGWEYIAGPSTREFTPEAAVDAGADTITFAADHGY